MHAYMGYNFYISEVSASQSETNGDVDIAVTVTQYGVAPFYYDLGLKLACSDLPNPVKLPGVDAIIERGDSKTFYFTGIPGTTTCLSAVSLKLDSSMAYPDRPIRFAQGANGTVQLDIPTVQLDIPTTGDFSDQEMIYEPSLAQSTARSIYLSSMSHIFYLFGYILAIKFAS